MRRTRIIMALTGIVLLGLTAVAVADNTEIDSFKAKQVTPGFVKYSGSLDGPKRCIKNRLYVIIHNGVEIASGETDDDGEFETEGPEPPDGDRVKVKFPKTSNPDCDKLSRTKRYHAPD